MAPRRKANYNPGGFGYGYGITDQQDLEEHRAMAQKYPHLSREQLMRMRGREFG